MYLEHDASFTQGDSDTLGISCDNAQLVEITNTTVVLCLVWAV